MEESLSQELKQILAQSGQHALLDERAMDQIDRLGRASLVYRKLLLEVPEYWLWLEQPENKEPFRHKAFQQIWQVEFLPQEISLELLAEALLRFRKKMLLRLAFVIVNRLLKNEEILKELSLLAEFCVQTLLEQILLLWEKRLGTPWDGAVNQKAMFCVLALGKLGGRELNFFSDLDLIYVYEGNGYCRKGEDETHTSNREFFTHVCQDLTKYLSYRSGGSILYNVDLRLRPDGSHGPIVQTPAAIEAYYSARGQTWEQLALMKARPIAGDFHLGEDLLENLNSFRYPRSSPIRVLQEVASVKTRMEKEVVGQDRLKRDIKNGFGGIREIEFIIQGLQILNAGKNPFLQHASTYESLKVLTRYQLLKANESAILYQGYTFLRELENFLQLKEEKQTYTLPESEEGLKTLANNMGYVSLGEFLDKIDRVRQGVRSLYEQFFPKSDLDEIIQDWFSFLCGEGVSVFVEEKLQHWFKGSGDIQGRLREFVLGSNQYTLTKSHVQLFVHLTEHFDYVFSSLADPIGVLDKIGVFAERYGARTQFLQMCSLNPNFFRALAMLFGRSDFIYKLLCQHPEIIEELLQITTKREKSVANMLDDIEHLPQDDDFPKYLWLYVKAEQVRVAIGEFLLNFTIEEVTHQLTTLADAVLQFTFDKYGLAKDLALIALGKSGGGNITFGSDLDLLLIGSSSPAPDLSERISAWEKCLNYSNPLGKTFEIDFRLRPFGADAPIVTTLSSFSEYHEKSARFWEKQILTKARFIVGNKKISREFFDIAHKLIYSHPISTENLEEIPRMLDKIRAEKSKGDEADSSIPIDLKRAIGGLTEIEFLAQAIQFSYGYKYEAIRTTHTSGILNAAVELSLISPDQGHVLLENYSYLSNLENRIRVNEFKGSVTMPENPEEKTRLAVSLGYGTFEEFSLEYVERLRQTSKAIESVYNVLKGQCSNP